MCTPQRYSFTFNGENKRIDAFAAEGCSELSRSRAKRLIEYGLITVNGKPVRPSQELKNGDRIEITIPVQCAVEVLPEEIPLKVIFENADVLVVEKPARTTTHPGAGNPNHTLVNALLNYAPEIASSGSATRPGIVHRLDKDTSGLMVVAKNEKAYLNLVRQFSEHSVRKIYLVLVKGELTPPEGIIDAPIGRDRIKRKTMTISSHGRTARTEYRVQTYFQEYTLLNVQIHTGRTHQIRVHFKAIGYPVIGDATYGVKVPFLKRQFLHAHLLGFKLPQNGEYVEFTSQLPGDLQQAINEIS